MNPPTVIRVTADHIAKGEPTSGDECPIALALFEQWPGGLRGIQVDTNAIYVWPAAGGELEGRPPAVAVDFIQAFDGECPERAEPFEFTVDEWLDQDGVGL